MKNTIIKLIAIIAVALTLFSFTLYAPASITGRVTPPEAIKDVWAMSLKDTFRANISQGGFSIMNVKPGTYKILIDAVAPYKDVIKEDVSVTDGQPVDLGEIKLEK
ncbi:MAG TPA: carboxypeptidase-like regulatory domain-containing protein [Chitinophagaceae bacterium]|nr:carboxypeptidase-like regulatory domain-containing protein [Chitinophagaceae bacterium]